MIWAELFRWFKTSSSSWATGQHPTGTPNPSYCIQPVHSPIGCVFGVLTKSPTSRKQQLSQVPSSPHHLQQTPPPSISLPNRWFSCCSSAQQCWLRNSSCASMSNFERSLRGGGTSTPRNNKVNNRYGPVGTGSRGPIDADELEGSPGSESSSPSVTRNTTPRQGGRYASTFNTMVRWHIFAVCIVAGSCCMGSLDWVLTATALMLDRVLDLGCAATAWLWHWPKEHTSCQECPGTLRPPSSASPEQQHGCRC